MTKYKKNGISPNCNKKMHYLYTDDIKKYFNERSFKPKIHDYFVRDLCPKSCNLCSSQPSSPPQPSPPPQDDNF